MKKSIFYSFIVVIIAAACGGPKSDGDKLKELIAKRDSLNVIYRKMGKEIRTLEEKISAIIEKKKNLMDGVVKEDDPGLLKGFSRKELIELIAAPD